MRGHYIDAFERKGFLRRLQAGQLDFFTEPVAALLVDRRTRPVIALI